MDAVSDSSPLSDQDFSLEDLITHSLQEDALDSQSSSNELEILSNITLANVVISQPAGYEGTTQEDIERPTVLLGTLLFITRQIFGESTTTEFAPQSLQAAFADGRKAISELQRATLMIMQNPSVINAEDNPVAKVITGAFVAAERLQSALFPESPDVISVSKLVGRLLPAAQQATKVIAVRHQQTPIPALKVRKGESLDLIAFVAGNTEMRILWERSDEAYAGLTKLAEILHTTGGAANSQALVEKCEHLSTLTEALEEALSRN
ncbi:MAG: hypothetical protein IAF58_05465 [Leptolyngbya sp.]|nr:hypothetical protein [Candidatus Melainabacteria bacterium]